MVIFHINVTRKETEVTVKTADCLVGKRFDNQALMALVLRMALEEILLDRLNCQVLYYLPSL
jgi:hypothetical protein